MFPGGWCYYVSNKFIERILQSGRSTSLLTTTGKPYSISVTGNCNKEQHLTGNSSLIVTKDSLLLKLQINFAENTAEVMDTGQSCIRAAHHVCPEYRY